MIRVATLGGDVKEFSYAFGTVADYASRAGMALDDRVTVSRNGKSAVHDTPVEDNDLLVVAPKISNG